MRERQFIEQNKEKWREFEALIEKRKNDPEKLGELFVQITDDLSYARTFYPNRSVRIYLNKLAQNVFDKLYKARKRRKSRWSSLFVDEIPSAIYHARFELLISLVIFIGAVLAGVFSSIKDPEFVKSILGEAYVRQTLENIAKGDPMAIYKGDNQFNMFLRIAWNNLLIDFRTFVSGIVFGIWTIVMLVSNGIMVGAFQYFFVQQGAFSASFLTIWMHGALEMSAAVIAGGAGLIVGRGIVFPGTYNRLQSLMIAGKQGLKILLIAVVMTTMAAVIESFVTRYTGMSNVVRLFWIVLSFAFVLGYFVVLPFMKWKRNTLLPKPVEKLQENLNLELKTTEPKSVGRLFSDGFIIYRTVMSRYLPIALFISLIATILNYFLAFETINDNFQFYFSYEYGPFTVIAWTFENIGRLFSVMPFDWQLLANALVLIGGISAAFYCFNQVLAERNVILKNKQASLFKTIGISIILTAIILSASFIPLSWIWLLVVTPMAFVFLFFCALQMNKSGGEAFRIMRVNMLQTYALYFCFALISTIVFTLITYAVLSLFFELAMMLFDLESVDVYKLLVGIYMFFCYSALLFVLPPMLYGISMTYFSHKERITADGLRASLSFLNDKS